MRPMLLALACLLATVAPVAATPFDFTAPEHAFIWDRNGPVALTSQMVPITFFGTFIPPSHPQAPGAMRLSLWVSEPPPVCPGCETPWGAMATNLDGQGPGHGPFSGEMEAAFTLIERNGAWDLKGWEAEGPGVAATPEPLSLLLMGGTLAVAGWVARKRRGR